MRLAAIDIGTNTILLLVAELTAAGEVTPVLELQEIPRLGEGVDAGALLQEEGKKRALKVLRRFADTARESGAGHILACGTSALRDAANRDDFLRSVRDSTGITIRVLSGWEEAERTYAGALSDLLGPESHAPATVLDVGGGSTEIVFGTGGRAQTGHSIDIGAVRLTERFFRSLPPTDTDYANAQASVRSSFVQIESRAPVGHLVAVAGTPITLASIAMALPTFDPLKTHGEVLSRGAIRQILAEIRPMSALQLSTLPQVQLGRADVLLAGTLILLELMDRLGAKELQVSSRGLRYGMVILDGAIIRPEGGV